MTIARNERSLQGDACLAIGMAEHTFENLVALANPSCTNPIAVFHEKIWNVLVAVPDITGMGDYFIDRLWASIDSDTEPCHELELIIYAVVAYAIAAMRSDKTGDYPLACSYLSDTFYWVGTLQAKYIALKLPPNAAATLAEKRHAEDESFKQYALEYWEQNLDTTLSATQAAEQLCNLNVVKLSHKTLAETIAREQRRRGIKTRRKPRS